MDAHHTTRRLDLRGYKCPLPVLKARKAMHGAAPGSRFVVEVTDPKAPKDFQDFCDVAGYRLTDTQATDFGYVLNLSIPLTPKAKEPGA